MKINIGIVGFGEFSESYLDLWINHPMVEKVVGAEIIKERREHIENSPNPTIPILIFIIKPPCFSKLI